MKRLFTLVLSAALTLSLTACGGTSGGDGGSKEDLSKATITTNEGDTVTMTAEELIEAYDSNEARFNKLYQHAKIEFTGTVDYIKVDTSVLIDGNKVTSGQQKIVFQEGWCLVLGEYNEEYDLADYSSGDKLKVTTGIFGSPYDTEFLQEVHGDNRVVWLLGDDVYNGLYSDIHTVISGPDAPLADNSDSSADSGADISGSDISIPAASSGGLAPSIDADISKPGV